MKFADLIKALQMGMNDQGEKLAVDGDPGPKTREALEKFNVIMMVSTPKEQPKPVTESRLAPALKLIKEFEGCHLKAYKDPIGIPTIGWGSIRHPDGRKVQMGDVLTQAQADEYLMHEVSKFAGHVDALVTRQIPNNAFCALVSFAYNVGEGNLGKSTLLKKLNGGSSLEVVAAEFAKWNKAAGKVLAGLTRRRAAERKLFLS